MQTELKPESFFFEDEPAGYFEQDCRPSEPGKFRYVAYRGIGHYRLMEFLKSSGPQRCYYLVGDIKHFFTVLECPVQGMLKLE